MNYLLDTNIISELISKTPDKRVTDFLLSIDEHNLYLSVITIGEIKSGIEKLNDGQKKDKLLHWLENDLLARFNHRIIPIDTEIMLEWGTTQSMLKKIGKPLPIMDSLIGVTVKVRQMTLLTRNGKDFQNLEIAIINPFEID